MRLHEIHFRCHVIVLGNLLLDSQLVVTLVFLLPPDVGIPAFSSL